MAEQGRKKSNAFEDRLRFTRWRVRTGLFRTAYLAKNKIKSNLPDTLREKYQLYLPGTPSQRTPYLTERQEIAWRKLSTQTLYSPEEREQQREYAGNMRVRFSIICWLENPKEVELEEFVSSVKNQTYPLWELLLCGNPGACEKQLAKLSGEDHRIRVSALESGRTWKGIPEAKGDYIAIAGQGDLLEESALYELARAIQDCGAEFLYTDEATFFETRKDAYLPHFKPDYAPETLDDYNYIGDFCVCSRELAVRMEPFWNPYDSGSKVKFIRLAACEALRVAHIPEILYYWRSRNGADAPFLNQSVSERKDGDPIEKNLTVETAGRLPNGAYNRIKFIPDTGELLTKPEVSVIIPNFEHLEDLKRCVDSILSKTQGPSYEILIVENNSRSEELFSYYTHLEQTDFRIRVIRYQGSFNFSSINNFAVNHSSGDYVLLLNNDTEVVSPEWMAELMKSVQKPEVAVSGAKLLFPDGRVQHGGVGLGIGGIAGHMFYEFPGDSAGYMGRLERRQNLTAVTAACMLVKKEIWQQVGGMDEELSVSYNDIDFCMKIRKAGYRIVWTPDAVLNHYESKSRGFDQSFEKWLRSENEVRLFKEKWGKELEQGDPYYNPNLSLTTSGFDFLPEIKPRSVRWSDRNPEKR